MPSLINYPHIASMAFNVPLYATPDVVSTVKAFLEPRLTGKAPDASMSSEVSPKLSVDDIDERRMTVKGKIAVIKVHGILVPRRGSINQACEELTSYEQLRNQIRIALDNELIEEIALDFHTGGGAAMGCKELADFIYQARQIKPITAIVNFAAYSAGFFLAAACSRIICSPTSGVGSIGVRMETVDLSKLEEGMGVKYTTFYRGGHKNDFSPHEPITEQAIAEADKSMDRAYATFTESVAQYRSLDVQTVIDTEARLYDPEEALTLGLIDEIAPAQDAVNQIASRYIAPPQRRIAAQAEAINLQSQY